MANQFLTAWDNMKKKQAAQANKDAENAYITNISSPKPTNPGMASTNVSASIFDGDTPTGGRNLPGMSDEERKNAALKALEGRIPHADKVTEFLTQNPTHSYDVMGYPTQKQPTVSSAVASAMAKLQELRKKTYTDPYGDDLNRMIEEFNNRKAFDYQLNTDQLFLNAREQYVNQGQKAMRDAMGAAATMTGGYGNSYASQVGNQAYQQYLQELNNSIPEFYGSALDKYNAEGQQMLDKINLKDAQRKDDYAIWEAQYLRDLENAALDYDMAVADEQAKNGTVTTTTEDKKEVSLSDAKNLNAALDELTKIAQTKGESAASAYAAQLVSAGYPEELVNARLQQIDEHGLIPLYDSLIYPDSEEDRKEYPWIVTNAGGGESYLGALNNDKVIYNKKTRESMTISEAYDQLIADGYSSSEAKEVLKTVNSMVYGGNGFYVERYEDNETKNYPISQTALKSLIAGTWERDDNGDFIDPETGKSYKLSELSSALRRIGYNTLGADLILYQ